MKYAIDQVLNELATEAQQLLGSSQQPIIEPANPKLGADFALPCFMFARELSQSPTNIANDLVSKLQHDSVEKLEATGGFVNIWLKSQYLAKSLYDDLQKLEGKQYGQHVFGKDQTVIVEYPSPNMAKPFSVGHLRPANQGWAITQLMKAVGYTVITDNHLGDWGTPFGKWVVGFRRYSSDQLLQQKGIYELARVYVQITADLKAEQSAGGSELANEVQSWLLKLEKGDSEAKEYSQRFAIISIDHMHHVMQRLHISTDYEYGEAFYVQDGKRMVRDLVRQGVAKRQTDGSVIVELEEYGIDTPMLLEKSNGAALYATSDLATLKFRVDKWQPTKVIYVVAAEQQFHFKQVFALADKLGYKSEYVHYWFGLIDQINEDGSRSKMSSRKGVVLLEELLDIAQQKARQHAVDGANLSDETVAHIALGAIKFTDFAQDKKTPILFDWERIFNMQGFSGPYIQYAAVRVGAILQKFGLGQWQDIVYDWHAEHDLLLKLTNYPVIVRQAAQQYEPHRIAQYLYELARVLNRYYETTSVGNEPNVATRQARLWLLGVVRQNFQHGLSLLGIDIPAKM